MFTNHHHQAGGEITTEQGYVSTTGPRTVSRAPTLTSLLPAYLSCNRKGCFPFDHHEGQGVETFLLVVDTDKFFIWEQPQC